MEIKKSLKIKGKSQEKLVPTLFDKNSMKLHYLTLKFFIEKGLEILSVDQVMRFIQEPVMRNYVVENACQRKLAKTKQEKQYRKNLSNVVYGRCLLNKRKHVDAVFVMSSRDFKREV